MKKNLTILFLLLMLTLLTSCWSNNSIDEEQKIQNNDLWVNDTISLAEKNDVSIWTWSENTKTVTNGFTQ